MCNDKNRGDLFMTGSYNCCGGDVRERESLSGSFRVECNRSILAATKPDKQNSVIKVVEEVRTVLS